MHGALQGLILILILCGSSWGDVDVADADPGSTTGPNTTGPNTTGPNTTGPNTTGPNTTCPNTTGSNTCRGLSAFELGNATFARVEGRRFPKQWKAAACPVEMTSTSCYWQSFQRAWDLEHRALPGSCRPFSVAKFERLIRCRTLLFLGDSLAVQYWQAVACLLPIAEAHLDVGWEPKFHGRICPFGAEHCYLRGSCVSFGRLSARVCLVLDKALQLSGPSFVKMGLSADSIVVANTGLHASTSQSLLISVTGFLRGLKNSNIPKASLPTVLWYETIAQHFPGRANGYWSLHRPKLYTACVPLDPEAAARQDWRNRILEPLLADAGIPVIRLYNLTLPLWDSHVVTSGRADLVARAEVDCTHYCVPSVTQHWAVRLLEKLEEVVTPKEGNCSWSDEVNPRLIVKGLSRFTAGGPPKAKHPKPKKGKH